MQEQQRTLQDRYLPPFPPPKKSPNPNHSNSHMKRSITKLYLICRIMRTWQSIKYPGLGAVHLYDFALHCIAAHRTAPHRTASWKSRSGRYVYSIGMCIVCLTLPAAEAVRVICYCCWLHKRWAGFSVQPGWEIANPFSWKPNNYTFTHRYGWRVATGSDRNLKLMSFDEKLLHWFPIQISQSLSSPSVVAEKVGSGFSYNPDCRAIKIVWRMKVLPCSDRLQDAKPWFSDMPSPDSTFSLVAPWACNGFRGFRMRHKVLK